MRGLAPRVLTPPRAKMTRTSLLTGFGSPQPPRWESHASPFCKARASTWVTVTSAMADVTPIKGPHEHTQVPATSGCVRRIGPPANTTGGLAPKCPKSPPKKTKNKKNRKTKKPNNQHTQHRQPGRLAGSMGGWLVFGFLFFLVFLVFWFF